MMEKDSSKILEVRVDKNETSGASGLTLWLRDFDLDYLFPHCCCIQPGYILIFAIDLERCDMIAKPFDMNIQNGTAIPHIEE
mmetsp:Transcript_33350/g.55824  ORF Transcript_33350/g.55824 Transcript_33350/m.55824 type:complete len:82 (-) Transcript_33350:232-477(-)